MKLTFSTASSLSLTPDESCGDLTFIKMLNKATKMSSWITSGFHGEIFILQLLVHASTKCSLVPLTTNVSSMKSTLFNSIFLQHRIFECKYSCFLNRISISLIIRILSHHRILLAELVVQGCVCAPMILT